MTREIELRIGELARRQHGVVTRAQLLELGLTAASVHRRERSGRLERVHRGVYLVGPIRTVRAREMGAVLACGPRAVVSHRSAAGLWGLVAKPDPSAPVHVTVPGGHNRTRPGIEVHKVRTLSADERAIVDSVPVTAPGRTLVGLAGQAGRAELERATAQAEREGLLTPAQLSALPDRYRRHPGVLRLRSVLEGEGGPALTRSEAEVRFLHLVRRAGLPAPEVNSRVAGYELDFFWSTECIAVEVDGYRYHGSRARFERDRRRASRLAARGVQIIPLTWRQIVDDGVATAVQLAQALDRARVARRPPRQSSDER